MKKSLYLFFLLIMVIISLTITHVVVSNMLSTTGVELDTLQVNVIKYKKENTLLHEQVLEQSSLFHIASAAAEMGFVPAKSTVYLSAPLPLAKR